MRGRSGERVREHETESVRTHAYRTIVRELPGFQFDGMGKPIASKSRGVYNALKHAHTYMQAQHILGRSRITISSPEFHQAVQLSVINRSVF